MLSNKTSQKRRKYVGILLVIFWLLALILLDLSSKNYVFENIGTHLSEIDQTSLLQVFVKPTGEAMRPFLGMQTWQLLLFLPLFVVAFGGVLVLAWFGGTQASRVGVVFMCGGVLASFVERLFRPFTVDWVLVGMCTINIEPSVLFRHGATLILPGYVFNLADLWLFLGGVLLWVGLAVAGETLLDRLYFVFKPVRERYLGEKANARFEGKRAEDLEERAEKAQKRALRKERRQTRREKSKI
jgi:lipoprotein signal peptidase